MCFSATASFTASALLAFLGALSIKKARTQSLQLFASTPIFFAIQQASEGGIWLSAANPTGLISVFATYLFLFFAMIVWPIWIPAVLLNLEKDSLRKKLLYIPLICGLMFSISAILYLIFYGATGAIIGHHIAYKTHQPPLIYAVIANSVYLIAIVTPFFISTLERMWLFGIGIALAYIYTYIWYAHHFTSVWCFLGALLSMLVLYIVSVNNTRR